MGALQCSSLLSRTSRDPVIRNLGRRPWEGATGELREGRGGRQLGVGRKGGSTHICCRPRKNGNSASATVKCNCHIGRGQEEDGGGAGTGRSSKMPQQDGAAADPRSQGKQRRSGEACRHLYPLSLLTYPSHFDPPHGEEDHDGEGIPMIASTLLEELSSYCMHMQCIARSCEGRGCICALRLMMT